LGLLSLLSISCVGVGVGRYRTDLSNTTTRHSPYCIITQLDLWWSPKYVPWVGSGLFDAEFNQLMLFLFTGNTLDSKNVFINVVCSQTLSNADTNVKYFSATEVCLVNWILSVQCRIEFSIELYYFRLAKVYLVNQIRCCVLGIKSSMRWSYLFFAGHAWEQRNYHSIWIIVRKIYLSRLQYIRYFEDDVCETINSLVVDTHFIYRICLSREKFYLQFCVITRKTNFMAIKICAVDEWENNR